MPERQPYRHPGSNNITHQDLDDSKRKWIIPSIYNKPLVLDRMHMHVARVTPSTRKAWPISRSYQTRFTLLHSRSHKLIDYSEPISDIERATPSNCLRHVQANPHLRRIFSNSIVKFRVTRGAILCDRHKILVYRSRFTRSTQTNKKTPPVSPVSPGNGKTMYVHYIHTL